MKTEGGGAHGVPLPCFCVVVFVAFCAKRIKNFCKIRKICSLLKISVISAICGSKKSCSAKAVESKCGVNFPSKFGDSRLRGKDALRQPIRVNSCACAL